MTEYEKKQMASFIAICEQIRKEESDEDNPFPDGHLPDHEIANALMKQFGHLDIPTLRAEFEGLAKKVPINKNGMVDYKAFWPLFIGSMLWKDELRQ